MNERTTMNKKPVYEVPAKSVINFESGFSHKLLCDGPTFSTGSACAYSCAFCYVPDLMRRSPHMKGVQEKHEQVVLRRKDAVDILRRQLVNQVTGKPKFNDPKDRRVIYASPLVDVAANMDLVRETIEACMVILQTTNWQIRLLSKSNMLPMVAKGLVEAVSPDVTPLPLRRGKDIQEIRDRMIFGVSTGTLDDKLALSFEQGTPLPSKRLQSLYWLQDNGFRTFGMICPSLPIPPLRTGPGYDTAAAYLDWAYDMRDAIRADRCEHVWAEVINVRGESMKRTVAALREGGYSQIAAELERVSHDTKAWEEYARHTFLAHATVYHRQPGKLRFLQYVTPASRAWWVDKQKIGAIVL